MNDERWLELWAKFLSAEAISGEEERELLEGLQRDESLQDQALRELELHGLLRARAKTPAEEEQFERAFFRCLDAERDATRFITKMERRIDEDASPGGGESRGGEGPPAHRRSPQRGSRAIRRMSERSFLIPVLAAVGILFGLVLLVSMGSSGPSRPQPGKGDAARREREKVEQARKDAEVETAALEEVRRRKAEDLAQAQGARKEGEEKLAKLREEERLAQEATKAAAATQGEERRKKAQGEVEAIGRMRKQEEERVAKLRDEEKRAEEEARPLPGSTPREKPKTEAAVARLVRVEGEVNIGADSGKSPAKGGEELLAGQGLEAPGGASLAVLSFRDQTRVEVKANTEVKELKAEGGKRVFVARGEVRAVVTKQPKDQPMVFATPHGEATVLGTTLRIVVDPDPKKGMRLEVEEGKVRLKDLAGKTVDVPSGSFAVAAVGAELAARPKDPPALARLKSAGEITVRFGPERLKLPEGVFIDAGGEFTPKRGYGWLGPNEVIKLPGFNEPVERRRTNFDPGREESDLHATRVSAGGAQHVETWVMKVPDGRYLVSVSVGRYAFTSMMGPHHVRIQGVQAIDAVNTGPGEFVEKKDVPVVVSNGEIRVFAGGHRRPVLAVDPPSDTALNYVMIKKAQP